MRIISIKVNKTEIYYAAMAKKDDGNIILEKDDKQAIPQNKTMPELMKYLKETFDNILAQSGSIDKVVFWCDFNKESPFIAMGLGILNYCCANKNIITDSKYTANITAKKLGFISNERQTAAINLMRSMYTNSKYKNQESRKIFAIGTLILREGKKNCYFKSKNM